MYSNFPEITLISSVGFRTRPRRNLTYLSIFLFLALAGFASISIKNYISRTTFFSLIEPEELVYEDKILTENATVTVKKGDTLKSILTKQGLTSTEIAQIIKAVTSKNNIAASLKIGQKISFDYTLNIIENDDDLTAETRTLTKVIVVLDKINSVEIIKVDDNFLAKNTAIPLNKFVAKSSVIINSSFISALKDLGLGANNIIELVNAYSYQIDFQRQIQRGDKITVITEKFMTESGQFSHHGKVLYVSLKLADKEYNIYRYSLLGDANYGFFSEDGKSVKRSLLKTPVNIVRVSSHYGNRKHPTLGFTKLHRGIDFAAPDGTPIYAAGDGVITEIGWKSGYGKFIQIKHSSNLSTAYAHASNFAKNLHAGSKVKQGQVIAYVGRTGRTTGSHLHYEVKIAGKHVNPMSIKTTPGIELTGKKLAQFQNFKNKIRALSTKLEATPILAADRDVTLSAR
ncbi:M23 family metallopeptidase [Candidatus Trichorickettsia mobilis]|jgi:murein DD-endopeptidase MepM/ murein hydrolase activator NlpD|uniref:M23 family metallopeptidase n=1 Tax=Candidatus Trichorickettsia mobilis TaxID=1346319 RepID=A0ABZ0USG0_9RICK|nr:peptidoglycan DD-metalloendopeptidase family protein [Candidatus Trichorickettsia mobilis]WPY00960.1 M23 family metallopeptidase [Candidatus Trichorickettsia mobilis]